MVSPLTMRNAALDASETCAVCLDGLYFTSDVDPSSCGEVRWVQILLPKLFVWGVTLPIVAGLMALLRRGCSSCKCTSVEERWAIPLCAYLPFIIYVGYASAVFAIFHSPLSLSLSLGIVVILPVVTLLAMALPAPDGHPSQRLLHSSWHVPDVDAVHRIASICAEMVEMLWLPIAVSYQSMGVLTLSVLSPIQATPPACSGGAGVAGLLRCFGFQHLLGSYLLLVLAGSLLQRMAFLMCGEHYRLISSPRQRLTWHALLLGGCFAALITLLVPGGPASWDVLHVADNPSLATLAIAECLIGLVVEHFNAALRLVLREHSPVTRRLLLIAWRVDAPMPNITYQGRLKGRCWCRASRNLPPFLRRQDFLACPRARADSEHSGDFDVQPHSSDSPLTRESSAGSLRVLLLQWRPGPDLALEELTVSDCEELSRLLTQHRKPLAVSEAGLRLRSPAQGYFPRGGAVAEAVQDSAGVNTVEMPGHRFATSLNGTVQTAAIGQRPLTEPHELSIFWNAGPDESPTALLTKGHKRTLTILKLRRRQPEGTEDGGAVQVGMSRRTKVTARPLSRCCMCELFRAVPRVLALNLHDGRSSSMELCRLSLRGYGVLASAGAAGIVHVLRMAGHSTESVVLAWFLSVLAILGLTGALIASCVHSLRHPASSASQSVSGEPCYYIADAVTVSLIGAGTLFALVALLRDERVCGHDTFCYPFFGLFALRSVVAVVYLLRNKRFSRASLPFALRQDTNRLVRQALAVCLCLCLPLCATAAWSSWLEAAGADSPDVSSGVGNCSAAVGGLAIVPADVFELPWALTARACLPVLEALTLRLWLEMIALPGHVTPQMDNATPTLPRDAAPTHGTSTANGDGTAGAEEDGVQPGSAPQRTLGGSDPESVASAALRGAGTGVNSPANA